jgi:hypothetical protein
MKASERERFCEASFRSEGQYWHAFTSGKDTSMIFATEDDFRFAMNIVALAAGQHPELKILAFNDNEFLTDMEVFTQLSRILSSDYGTDRLRNLSQAQKLDLARRLRRDFRSSNEQIRRVLGLSRYEIDTLFPLSAKRA